MSVNGPTKAEMAEDVLSLLLEGYGDMADYVSFNRKPEGWYPTIADVRRSLLLRTRDQLWGYLDNLTAP